LTDDELSSGRELYEACVDAGLIPPANWNGLDSLESAKWSAVARRTDADTLEELVDDKVDDLRDEIEAKCTTTFVRSADILNIIHKWFE
jgi:hypothetical protein